MASKDDDILDEAKELFQACEDRESDNRDQALDDLEFARLSKQWRTEDEEQRASEGRPCLTINRMPAFIRQVVNDSRQNAPSITVRPVDDAADPATAEVMSDLIRDIESQSDADTAYDTAVDFAVSCGFGYFRINTAYVSDDSFEQDIRIGRIANPFSVYGDPYSDAPDSSDWNCAFILDKMKRSLFEKRYKGADLVSWNDPRWNDVKSGAWKDGDDIGIAEYWCREEVTKQVQLLSNGMIVDLKEYAKNKGLFDAQKVQLMGSPRPVKSHKVTQYLMTACDVLQTTEWAGKYIPIVPVYGEDINVAGTRYLRSLIRDAKDPQRMFNYWRTASTELVALAPKAPWIGKKGTFKSDAAKWATANRASHPYIEFDTEAPQRQPFQGTPVGVINEALAASDDMKAIMGLHDASLGAKSNETSGRAIQMRQREGDVSTFHFQDNLNRAVRHGGRILVDLIPKVYSTPRVVRVLGQDKTNRLVKINEKFEEKGGVTRIYDLNVGRYDLAVDAGPSFTTRREEAATQMMELIQAFPQAAPVIGDLIAEKLDWPGATEIAKRLKTLLPPQLQVPEEGEEGQPTGEPQAPAISPELLQAIEDGKAIIGQLQQELSDTKGALDKAKADNWAAAMKVRIDAFNAQTNRMKVTMAPVAPDPLEVPAEASLQA